MTMIVTVSLGVTSLPVHADDSANSESTSQTNLGRDTESVEEQSDTSDRPENDQVDKDASDNGDSTELDTTEPAAADSTAGEDAESAVDDSSSQTEQKSNDQKQTTDSGEASEEESNKNDTETNTEQQKGTSDSASAQEGSLSESVDQPETPASQSTQPETSQDNKILNPIIRRIIRPSDTKTAVYRFYNGDQLVSEQTVKDGDTLLEPEAPVKVDETFTGWYAKDSDEKFDGFGTVGDITEDGQSYDYYARFSANTVYVYYYDQYDNLIDTVTAQQDTDIKISENMPMIQVEPLTQHHEGWHLEGSTEDVSGEYRVGTESVKLYPILKEGYWVNYDSNGGSSIASQFIDRNASPDQKKASQPSVIPAKEGYTFEGWYSDKELTNKYDFNSEVDAPLTLYAKYVPKTDTGYSVRYWIEYQTDATSNNGRGSWGYKFVGRESRTGTTGSNAEYDGDYIFKAPVNLVKYGYSLNTEKTKTIPIAADGTTILDVYYDCRAYDIAFHFPGPDGKPHTVSDRNVKFSASLAYLWEQIYAIKPKEKLFDGNHRFAGGPDTRFVADDSELSTMLDRGNSVYNYQGMGTENSFYNVFCETLHGKAPNGQTIVRNVSRRGSGDTRSYYLHHSGAFTSGGNGALDNGDIGVEGFTPALDLSDGHYLVYKNGKIVVWYRYHQGWDDVHQLVDENGKGVSYWGKDMPLNIYLTRNIYTITYHTAGGPSIDTASVPYEDDVRQYEPKEYIAGNTQMTEGNQKLVFAGWYKDARLTEPFDFDITMPAYNLELYAKWEPIKYTVTFDTAGGSTIAPIKNIAYGSTIEKPADPVYEGRIFLGWTLNGEPYNFADGVTDDITLKAEWRSIKAYQATYDLNGGSGTTPVDDTAYYENGRVVVADAGSIKAPDGKVFLGWKCSGDGKIYYPGGVAPMKFGGMTFTAQWGDADTAISMKYDFNFKSYGIAAEGNESKTVNGITNNRRITLADFDTMGQTPKGWRFDGWYLDADCTDGPYTDVLVDRNDEEKNVVYAKWTKISSDVMPKHHHHHHHGDGDSQSDRVENNALIPKAVNAQPASNPPADSTEATAVESAVRPVETVTADTDQKVLSASRGAGAPAGRSAVSTGDNSQIIIFGIVFLIAGAGLAVLLMKGKRNRA